MQRRAAGGHVTERALKTHKRVRHSFFPPAASQHARITFPLVVGVTSTLIAGSTSGAGQEGRWRAGGRARRQTPPTKSLEAQGGNTVAHAIVQGSFD